ncbi:DUF2267 domain-containing protein [Micromonospora zamorensis]|uniref:DUF2267 domain-containing protein n=1 Tax=Micromonospora zamorensis TaxID=709883 RepID=UPI002ED4618F|nr:DUF2267 domain-containing protein [Micromonospora zamorensis]
MRKQMEGDNQRRRALARQAREQNRQPSEIGASLSATKQLKSLDSGKRAGPPAAGLHKPDSTRGGPAPPPLGTADNPRPQPSPPSGAAGVSTMGYHDLVDEVRRRAGVDFKTAKVGTEATVLVLAFALEAAERQRLLAAVPASLHDVLPVDGIERHQDLPGFLAEVGRISGNTPEQARYQAEATIAALAEQDGDLVESLHVPDGLRDLLNPPEAGGGLVGASTTTPTLDADEISAALDDLPYWAGDSQGLYRVVALPPDNLDRVLARLDRLRQDNGRGPSIGRPGGTAAVLTVRTSQADGVTALDVDLAQQIDDAIDEVGAGMAGG